MNLEAEPGSCFSIIEINQRWWLWWIRWYTVTYYSAIRPDALLGTPLPPVVRTLTGKVSHQRGLAGLNAVINNALHEALEWYSVDGVRVVNPHHQRVERWLARVSWWLAWWCWRLRRVAPGSPRPR